MPEQEYVAGFAGEVVCDPIRNHGESLVYPPNLSVVNAIAGGRKPLRVGNALILACTAWRLAAATRVLEVAAGPAKRGRALTKLPSLRFAITERTFLTPWSPSDTVSVACWQVVCGQLAGVNLALTSLPLRWTDKVFNFTSEGMVILTDTELLAGVVISVNCDGRALGSACANTVPTKREEMIVSSICNWRMTFLVHNPARQVTAQLGNPGVARNVPIRIHVNIAAATVSTAFTYLHEVAELCDRIRSRRVGPSQALGQMEEYECEVFSESADAR